jgi:hypothetical protein
VDQESWDPPLGKVLRPFDIAAAVMALPTPRPEGPSPGLTRAASTAAARAVASPGIMGHMAGQGAADRVRARIGAAIFERVAGPQGPERRRVIRAEGDRMFAEDRPIRRVHGDSAMFIGGIRALLLQSLHPLAMAAVAGHSGYRGDPWGRLQRTSYFLAVTTFGRVSDAQEAIGRVRAIHERVTGTAPDGLSPASSAAWPALAGCAWASGRATLARGRGLGENTARCATTLRAAPAAGYG